jgi:hypothetical protein
MRRQRCICLAQRLDDLQEGRVANLTNEMVRWRTISLVKTFAALNIRLRLFFKMEEVR